jgi:hypothetical protein
LESMCCFCVSKPSIAALMICGVSLVGMCALRTIHLNSVLVELGRCWAVIGPDELISKRNPKETISKRTVKTIAERARESALVTGICPVLCAPGGVAHVLSCPFHVNR